MVLRGSQPVYIIINPVFLIVPLKYIVYIFGVTKYF